MKDAINVLRFLIPLQCIAIVSIAFFHDLTVAVKELVILV